MSEPVFIIAEAGVNHNGSLTQAMQLIDVAVEAGADAVKFQTFHAEQLATPGAQRADYQVANLREPGNQLDMLKKLQLSQAEHQLMLDHCTKRGIAFMSTAFDPQSLHYLAGLGMPALKIPSGDITCAPLLLQAAHYRQRLLISTGMATLGDIEQALAWVAYGLLHRSHPTQFADIEKAYFSTQGQRALKKYVTLLHCVTEYPAPPGSVNLRAMDSMAAAFGLPVGYSDHTLGTEVALAAVAREACVIEKHFTLDRKLPGPDHAASLVPDELQYMVKSIRRVEQSLGNSAKMPGRQEQANRAAARRSLVAARALDKGDILDWDNLACKRPGTGLSPMDIFQVLGRSVSSHLSENDPIQP